MARWWEFLSGVLAGGLLTGLLLVAAPRLPAGLSEPLAAGWAWAWRNLGWSLWGFLLTGLFYGVGLLSLRRRLRQGPPVEEVAQREHLLEVWIGLFFGIGVIWTAVGMRGALLHALGGENAVEARDLLERLVDGGILVALSSTIVGGVGGYLMRVLRAVWVGGALRAYYEALEQDRSRRVETLLLGIHQGLNGRKLEDRRDSTTLTAGQ